MSGREGRGWIESQSKVSVMDYRCDSRGRFYMDAELEKWVLDNNINGIESGYNEYINIKRGTLIGILAAIKQLNKGLQELKHGHPTTTT